MNSNSLHYYRQQPSSAVPQRVNGDVCIYGGTVAGIISALQIKLAGYNPVIVEFGAHIGGVTCGGLGATDIGNKMAIGGMARQFYRDLGSRYGKEESWGFEPHVAEAVLTDYLQKTGIPAYRNQHLQEVLKEENAICEIRMDDGSTYRAKYFIDASYEGDLMAGAGVSHTAGRECNKVYDETLNGIHHGHPGHNFRRFVDPYKISGDATSGLLWGISEDSSGQEGEGDKRIQAFNFRLCLTAADDNKLPFPCPPGYEPERYEILRRYLEAGIWDALYLSKPMPNGKTDTNNNGAFSTDNIGRNHEWPEASYGRREEIFQDHVTYQMGLLYFLQNDPDLPDFVREDMRPWGLAADEFIRTGGWPHALYVREARRMVSDCVMTEHHAVGRHVEHDSIGLAAYQMDSHSCRRIVRGGRVHNEGNVEISGFCPYGISYRAICPKENECTNLLVPWCLSASHIVFGSIRMEPVGMVLGQSAALAITLALRHACPVQQVSIPELQKLLREAGQVIDKPARQTLRRFAGTQELLS